MNNHSFLDEDKVLGTGKLADTASWQASQFTRLQGYIPVSLERRVIVYCPKD